MKSSEKAGKKAEKDREKVPSAQGFPLFPLPARRCRPRSFAPLSIFWIGGR